MDFNHGPFSLFSDDELEQLSKDPTRYEAVEVDLSALGDFSPIEDPEPLDFDEWYEEHEELLNAFDKLGAMRLAWNTARLFLAFENSSDLGGLLATAAEYLDHPDVREVPFALPSHAVAQRLRDAIRTLREA